VGWGREVMREMEEVGLGVWGRGGEVGSLGWWLWWGGVGRGGGGSRIVVVQSTAGVCLFAQAVLAAPSNMQSCVGWHNGFCSVASTVSICKAAHWSGSWTRLLD
jgi:hypothetical protein